MYQHNTPIIEIEQVQEKRLSWFTLVEIMIVIVIIILLTQIGNVSSLFQQKEKGQLEQVAVQALSMIDEEKTNALLGKTYKKNNAWGANWEIVRKRSISLLVDDAENTISLVSRVNLAQEKEDTYEPDIISKTWTEQGLTGSWYDCSVGAEGVELQNGGGTIHDVMIEFSHDKITFATGTISNQSSINALHIVLKISRNKSHQEIHIDKRTGLTYIRSWNPETVLCN